MQTINIPKFHIPFSRTVASYCFELKYTKQMRSCGWAFSPTRLHMIKHERKDWTNYYCPIDLHGKTVLDVGAGEGETAKVFLEAGAKRVICIECDSERLPYLLANASKWPITPVFRPFRVGDLFMPGVDFIKVDIEGYEELVLPYRLPVPAVFEVHGLQMRDKFEAAGYQMVLPEGGAWWTCYGYWMCKPFVERIVECSHEFVAMPKLLFPAKQNIRGGC